MAIYFVKYFNESFTGILFTLSVIASIFAGAIAGYLTDIIGRRKIIVLSEGIFFLSYVVIAFANSPVYFSPLLTALLFLLINFTWGIFAPADEAMLLDVTKIEERPLMYAIIYWSHNLTMAFGAAIGAFLFTEHLFILLVILSIVLFISFVVTYFYISETMKTTVVQRKTKNNFNFKGFFNSYVKVFADTPFILFVVAGLLVHTLEVQLQNYIGVRLAKEVTEQQIFNFTFDGIKMLGFLQTENTILVVLLAGFAVKLVNRFNKQKLLLIGTLLYTIGYSYVTGGNNILFLFLAMFIATIGEIIGVPIKQTMMSSLIPNESKGAYLVVNGTVFQLSRILASIGIMLGSILSGEQMGIIAFLLGLGGLIIYYLVMPNLQSRFNKETACEN